jgi:hypothetical protein
MSEPLHVFGPDELFGCDEVWGFEVEAIPSREGIDARTAKGTLTNVTGDLLLTDSPDAQTELGDDPGRPAA